MELYFIFGFIVGAAIFLLVGLKMGFNLVHETEYKILVCKKSIVNLEKQISNLNKKDQH
jgi:hypothetical protein